MVGVGDAGDDGPSVAVEGMGDEGTKMTSQGWCCAREVTASRNGASLAARSPLEVLFIVLRWRD